MTEKTAPQNLQNGLSGQPSIDGDAHIIGTTIANSRLLIMAAAERGRAIDKDILRVIVETDDAFQKNGLTCQQKITFWHAYEQLSSRMRPISIEGIRATYDQSPARGGFIWACLRKIKLTYSQKCVFSYKLLSSLTLLALIILQVYWSIGHSLVRDIKTQTDEILSLEKQIRTLQMKKAAREMPASSKIERYELSPKTEETVPRKIPLRTTEGIALGAIDSRLEHLFSWREANFGQLRGWNRLWGSALFMLKQPWEKASFQELPKESRQHIQYLAALYVLDAISQYFLPILYGLLGSTVYVLRQIPLEIGNLTFSVNSQINFSLRVTQGPLAGIMASFFFSGNHTSIRSILSDGSLSNAANIESYTFSHLGPLATAFLAGYSVELLFKAIDKVISMITSKTPAGKMPPSGTAGSRQSMP